MTKFGGESQADPVNRALVIVESFPGQSCLLNCTIDESAHLHQAAPPIPFLSLHFVLLIIPFLPHVFPESNSCRQRRSRFRVVNTSFICLGSNINMGIREQGSCVHNCWRSDYCHGSWCCILPDWFSMTAPCAFWWCDHSADRAILEIEHNWTRHTQEVKQEGEAEEKGGGEEGRRCRERHIRAQAQSSNCWIRRRASWSRRDNCRESIWTRTEGLRCEAESCRKHVLWQQRLQQSNRVIR